jgi:hypothetical protein
MSDLPVAVLATIASRARGDTGAREFLHERERKRDSNRGTST